MKKILFILFLAGCTKTNTELVKQVITDTVIVKLPPVVDSVFIPQPDPPKITDTFSIQFLGEVWMQLYGYSEPPYQYGAEIVLEVGVRTIQYGDSIRSFAFTQFTDSTYSIPVVGTAFFQCTNPGEIDSWAGDATFCMAILQNQELFAAGQIFYYGCLVTDKFGNSVLAKTSINTP